MFQSLRPPSDINSLIDKVIAIAGGYSDHPMDRGGPTRWDVTETVARAHRYRGDVRHFRQNEAAAIYRCKYWHRPGFDRVGQYARYLAGELFDTGINKGSGIATGSLQPARNALNRNGGHYSDIAADRQIGDQTRAALETFRHRRGSRGEAVPLKAVEAVQDERYIKLAARRPANEAFQYG